MNLKNRPRRSCGPMRILLKMNLFVSGMGCVVSCVTKEQNAVPAQVELVEVEVGYEKDDVVSGAMQAWTLTDESGKLVQASGEPQTLEPEQPKEIPKKEKALALRQALVEGNLEALRSELPKLDLKRSAQPFSGLLIALIDLQLGKRVLARAHLVEVWRSFEKKRNNMAPKQVDQFQYLYLVTAGAIDLELGHREKGLASLAEARMLMPSRGTWVGSSSLL